MLWITRDIRVRATSSVTMSTTTNTKGCSRLRRGSSTKRPARPWQTHRCRRAAVLLAMAGITGAVVSRACLRHALIVIVLAYRAPLPSIRTKWALGKNATRGRRLAVLAVLAAVATASLLRQIHARAVAGVATPRTIA